MFLLLLLACAPEPENFADCARLEDVVPREDCRLTFARESLDDPDGLMALIDAVDDEASRDLLINRLAKIDPRRAGHLCEKTSTPAGRSKCRGVVGRPHLRAPRPGEERPGEDRPGGDRPGEGRPGEDQPGEGSPAGAPAK